MKHGLSRRGKIRIISFLSILVLVLSIWGGIETYKRRTYQQLVKISQERALAELGNYVTNISVALQKGRYANTPPMIANLASSLWREATGAKTCLSQLESGGTQLYNTYKFLSQVGEFTMALNRKVAADEHITDEERKQLDELLKYAQSLADQINYMQSMYENDALTFDAKKQGLLLSDAADTQKLSYVEGIANAEQTMTDYPTLLYDGPFSDNIDQKESKLLKESDPVSREEARKIAASFLGADPSQVADAGDEEGKMAAYLFSYESKVINITKKGGFISYMLCSDFAGEEKIDQRQAVDIAKKYLEKHGYKNMKESYFSTNDGICTINFAYMEDDVACYPDLIKVNVALDTGNVCGIDARGYIMNHHERKIPENIVSSDKAKQSLSKNLTVQDVQLAFIPKDNGDEELTYEFLCKSKDDQDVLVYINVDSLEESEILILLYTDGGMLTK